MDPQAGADIRTVDELAAMGWDDRVRWFLDHPLEGEQDTDPRISRRWIAETGVRSVIAIARRDAEQADRRAS